MSNDAPAIDDDLADSISGTHLRALEKVFQHPLTHNLTRREITRLFETIGTAEHQHNGDLMLRLEGEHLLLKPARGKDVDATEVMDVRHLLERAGWSDKAIEPVAQAASNCPDMMILIDHDGARLYRLDANNLTMSAEETHHLRRERINLKDHDADRDESYPVDTHFFEAVAAELPDEGRIVVVSRGGGQSNEGDHLVAYLDLHHRTLHERMVGNLVADLTHMTVPQIVEFAREALGTTPVLPVDA